ncbi:MAG: DUF3391 domain-containing protein, partial [Candidatus Nitrotoga sp.]
MKTKIPSGKLTIGMFVSDLDRSWLGTPFLLQGFLIENDEEIKQLQECCTFVLIEWDRSAQGLQAAIPAPRKTEPERQSFITPQSTSLTDAPDSTIQTPIADHSAPEPIKEKPADLQTPVALIVKDAVLEPAELGHLTHTETTPKNLNKYLHATPEVQSKAGLLASFSGKIKDFFKIKSDFKDKSYAQKNSIDSEQHPTAPEVRIVSAQRPDFIPVNVELTIYNEDRPVEEELTPAGKAYTLTEEVLHGLVQNIRSDKDLEIEEVETVIQEVVDSMVRNPNALMLIM